jgi:hypothetical protein
MMDNADQVPYAIDSGAAYRLWQLSESLPEFFQTRRGRITVRKVNEDYAALNEDGFKRVVVTSL